MDIAGSKIVEILETRKQDKKIEVVMAADKGLTGCFMVQFTPAHMDQQGKVSLPNWTTTAPELALFPPIKCHLERHIRKALWGEAPTTNSLISHLLLKEEMVLPIPVARPC